MLDSESSGGPGERNIMHTTPSFSRACLANVATLCAILLLSLTFANSASASCRAYDLVSGIFTTKLPFQNREQEGFNARIKPGDTARYEIVYLGAVIATQLRSGYEYSFGWKLFPGNRFLAVRLVRKSGGKSSFILDVWDVSDTSSPKEVSSIKVDTPSGTFNPELVLNPSADGKAYHLYVGVGADRTTNHGVYRSDSGRILCGGNPQTVLDAGQLFAKRSGDYIEIYLSPLSPTSRPVATCLLPAGSLTVVEDCQTFPEVVLGGVGPTTTTRTYTLRNDGDDCEVVSSISDAAPFNVQRTSTALAASLDVGETMTVQVGFEPSSSGSTGYVNLPITRSPANGDDQLCAMGHARDPVASLYFSRSALSFGTHPIGSSTRGALMITNDGEIDVTVEIPSSSGSSAFSWPSLPSGTTLEPSASRTVDVTFSPTSEGTYGGALRVNSSLPSSPKRIQLSGVGCVPDGSLSFPPVPSLAYGEVEVGYRGVRFVTVVNVGGGDAVLRARIDDTSSGFGLADDSGSITSSETERTWTIAPVTRCGPGATGSGDQIVAVNFWSNGAPGSRSATLTLEQLAGGVAVSSDSYPLTAQVVPAAALDLGLAIDRSGSMSQTVCARQKSQAAIEAGQLLVQLMRSDVDDRVSTVRFNHNPQVLQSVVAVSDTTAPTKATIASGLNQSSLDPSGNTSIAGGAIVALHEIETPRATLPVNLRKSVVVLTDGKDNRAYQDPATGQWYSVMGGRSRKPVGVFWFGLDWVDTEPLPWPSDVKGYAVGIGAEEDIDRGQLAELSAGAGGFYQVVTCLDGKDFFQLEKYFLQIFMDSVGLESVEDPVFVINPGETHRFEFDLLRGDVGGLVTIFDRAGVRLPFRLISPTGEELSLAATPSGFLVRSGVSPTARFLEFKVPQSEPDRYGGRWVIEIGYPRSWGPGETLEVGGHEQGPGKNAVIYGIAIGAGSNLRMQPQVTAGRVKLGDSIQIRTVLSEGGWPVPGGNIQVEVTSPSGAIAVMPLFDDGAHEDGAAADGEYAARYGSTAEGGSYVFTIRAEARSRDDEAVVRETTVAKYVEGRLPLDPNPGMGPGSRPGDHQVGLLVGGLLTDNTLALNSGGQIGFNYRQRFHRHWSWEVETDLAFIDDGTNDGLLGSARSQLLCHLGAATGRVQPFVELALGVAHYDSLGTSDTGLLGSLGGGADFRWNPHVGFRLDLRVLGLDDVVASGWTTNVEILWGSTFSF